MTKQMDETIAGLLPFYVAGTLDEGEARMVARWLESDPRGSEALQRALEEQAQVIAANERIKVPSGGLARLMEDVAAEPRVARRSPPGLNLFDRIMGWIREAPPSMSWGAVAALALVVAIQNVPLPFGGTDAPYEVSSGGPVESGKLYLIRFADDADMAAVSAVLSDAGAVITDGPKGNGNYVVRLAEGGASGSIETRLDALRAKRGIVKLVIEKSNGKK